MTPANIFGFVLVLLAGGVVALAWIISDLKRASLSTASSVDLVRRHCASFATRLATVEKQSPTSLAAEVAALADAVGRLRQMQMRFQGRFDATMSRQRPAILDGETGQPLEGDDEIAAMIALQSAKPAGPGNGSP